MKCWNCVAIIGVGLIGGSVGLALRKRGLARRIVGAGSRSATLETALKLGAITETAADIPQAVKDAELIVVCTPVEQIVDHVRLAAGACRQGAIITDVGSTKVDIVEAMSSVASEPGWSRGVRFLGSHPLAGNEKTGPQNGSATLFEGRTVVITPTAKTPAGVQKTLSDFWSGLGAKIVSMSAEEHDQAVAATSHLPHLIAAGLAGVTPEAYLPLTGSGWQDTTRIAAGDPVLWRQIMLTNRENLIAQIDRFSAQLAEWRVALEASDAVRLEQLLAEAKRVRDIAKS